MWRKHRNPALRRSAKIGWEAHTYAHISDVFIIFFFCTVFFSILKKIRHIHRATLRMKRNERNGSLRLHISFFFLFCLEKVKVSRNLQRAFLLLRPGRRPGRQRAACFFFSARFRDPSIYHVKRQTRRWHRA